MLVMDRHYLCFFLATCTQARGFIKDTTAHNNTIYASSDKFKTVEMKRQPKYFRILHSSIKCVHRSGPKILHHIQF